MLDMQVRRIRIENDLRGLCSVEPKREMWEGREMTL